MRAAFLAEEVLRDGYTLQHPARNEERGCLSGLTADQREALMERLVAHAVELAEQVKAAHERRVRP